MRTAYIAVAAFLVVTGNAEAQAAARKTNQAIPASVREPQILSDIRAEVEPVYEMEELAGPLGVRRLDSASIPAGGREIRIYTGAIAGYPATGLIISDIPGRVPRVSGRVFRYWPTNNAEFTEGVDLEAAYAEIEAGRCGKPVRGKDAVVCDVQFEQVPDWKALLQVLDSANAWSLPDQSKVPRRSVMMIHGWRIRAESRRDTSYHLWWYDNPQLFKPPDGSNAHRIMRLVYDLLDQAKPPSSIRYERGIYLYGPDTSDFIPCGRPRDAGYAEGMLSAVAKIIGDSAWRARAAPTRAFFIEGWFHLRTATEFQRGNRKLHTRWSVDTLTVSRPSAARTCR